jgi:signal transduction histidine kinase
VSLAKRSVRNHRLLAGTAVLAFVVLALLALWTSRELGRAADRVKHTLAVGAVVEALLGDATDLETAVRGYVLTGDERFLAPARAAAARWPARLDRLGALARDPEEAARVAPLRAHLEAKEAFTREVAELRARAGFAAARDLVATGEGMARMDAVRAGLGALRDLEQGRLAVEIARADEARRVATGTAFAAVAALSAAFAALLLSVRRDARERAALEAQLVVAGRMASVGTLAAGVAHEINNPLACVASNLGFVADQLEVPWEEVGPELRAEVDQALADAREGVGRIRDVVDDLRVFARGRDDEPQPVDVRRVMRAAATMVRPELRDRARIELELSDVPPVRASEARLCQVFVNLLVNAAHATPPGAPDDHPIRLYARARGTEVIAEVRDSGRGIPPEVLPRVFEPFFTTKGPGGGTGLGLSVCHGIVSALGGSIEAESEPGRGSTFRVRLPSAARESQASGSAG